MEDDGVEQSTGTFRYSVVGDAVFNRCPFCDWLRNVRIFAKDVRKRSGIDRTEGQCRQGITATSMVGFHINQATFSVVNEEIDVTKEICANDRVVNIGKNKNQRKGTVETNVKG